MLEELMLQQQTAEFKMKISELKVNQGNVDVEGIIKSIAEARTFNKYGKDLKVANAVLEDESGNIKLSLWNDDILKVKEGDKIKIINGYVSEFNGIKQISSGKYGKIEFAGASAGASAPAIEEKPKAGRKRSAVEEKEF
jgi:replication factor A1